MDYLRSSIGQAEFSKIKVEAIGIGKLSDPGLMLYENFLKRPPGFQQVDTKGIGQLGEDIVRFWIENSDFREIMDLTKRPQPRKAVDFIIHNTKTLIEVETRTASEEGATLTLLGSIIKP